MNILKTIAFYSTVLSICSCYTNRSGTNNNTFSAKDSLEKTMPVPGNGTVSTNIKTPLGESVTTTQYVSEEKSKITTVLHLYSNQQRSYIIIRREGRNDLKLQMMEAWAKGAEFRDGNTTWKAQGSIGELIENGLSTKYNAIL